MIGLKIVADDDDTESQQPDDGVSCSICLESVFSFNGGRSTAKLHCGHEFHLDCIGSAFNMKGEMQCPNCRKVEKGRWLYSNGSTRIGPEFNMDDWQRDYNPDEEPYDVAFPELPYRFHWCPFGGITSVRSSSFEEVEAPSATYHATFTEHTAGSSVSQSYVTYVGHTPPPSLNSSDTVEFDDPGYNLLWNGLSGQNETASLRDVLPHDLHHSRTRRFPPTSNGADQASNTPATLRSTHGELDFMTRSTSFAHPFFHGHWSDPRATGSPSNLPHHPTRNRDRIMRPRVINRSQQPTTSPSISPGLRRYNVPRRVHPDQTSGFFAPENHLPVHTNPLERDYISHFPASSFDRDSSGWQASDGSDSGNNRTSNVWPRPW